MAPTFERPARCSALELEGALRAPIDGGIREQVAALLERGERRIIVSVKRLSDIDAAGLGELIHVANTSMAAGGVLQIADAERRIRELLRATGLSGLLVDRLDDRRGPRRSLRLGLRVPRRNC